MKINFTVVSDSMHPVIKIGDQLVVDHKNRDFKIFDIILFKRGDKLVVHYIWRNQLYFNKTLISRCLKNIFQDEEPINESELLGLVSNFKIDKFTRAKILFFCWLMRRI